MKIFNNPFRPGAGQIPPYLAGRQKEQDDFISHLSQIPVLKNLIITGLRGVGKTVLLESLKPIALDNKWLWAGTDLSESTSVSENNLSTRIIVDLAAFSSSFIYDKSQYKSVGFKPSLKNVKTYLSYDLLSQIYNNTPGLEVDKLKVVLITVWNAVKGKTKGIVLAYDEAQNLKDQSVDKQYPLSVLLEVIQFLQRHGIPYLFILTGLPTLLPNLVEARTYSERMFHVMTLGRLNELESKDAILKPTKQTNCPVKFSDSAIQKIVKFSGGYPYFIQFLCKETFDSYIQQLKIGNKHPHVSIEDTMRKLDTDFYSGRWSKITDRQKDLLTVIAKLSLPEDEFTVQDISVKSKQILKNSFTPSLIVQMLSKLIDIGLVYKNRHGKYSFAVPMFSDFINRIE